jgi:dihydroflavonol-4-reductase
MILEKSNILVTGANGFLGSWLIKKLTTLNVNIYILARENSDLSEIKEFQFIKITGDITNKQACLQAVKNIDIVFHLAGLISYSSFDRKKMEQVNVEGTRNILDSSIESKVKKFIFVSSVVAIGAGFSPSDVLNESSEFNLEKYNLGYFETKRAAEKIILEATKNKKIDACILNPSTIYGPGDAKKSSRKNQLKVARGKLSFYSNGGVSVIDIRDVVEAIITAAVKGRSGERYILSGDNLLIKEVFDLIAEAANQKKPVFLIPKLILNIVGLLSDFLFSRGLIKKSFLTKETVIAATLYHWFDNSKAKKELRLKTRPAKESIADSVKWMKDNNYIK